MNTNPGNTDQEWPQWKTRMHSVIFGTDTREGRLFDLILLLSIVASVLVVLPALRREAWIRPY